MKLEFLGMSAKLQKLTIRFITSVCLSVCLSVHTEQLDSQWMISTEI